MSDADRALAPLDAARAAIEKLETYTTPQELAVALEAIGQAVERSLRQLLRLDASQPDDVRLQAQDPGAIPFDRVVSLLRQRNRISLNLANETHALRHAAARAASGDVRAADADQALALVARVREEIRQEPHPQSREESDDAVLAATHAAVERGEFDERAHAVPLRSRLAPLRIVLVLAAIALFAAGYLLVSQLSGSSQLEQGVAAFEAGRLVEAERLFRAELERGENATAELYLARVLRTGGRHQEAGALLNAARKRYPEDADILRELGHLLVDLERPESALEPYRRALELDPDETANWVALIRALRAAGDPSAEQWLARAPADAQAILR